MHDSVCQTRGHDCDEVDAIRAALTFYATPANWERQITPESAPYCLPSAISNDLGRTARMALGLPEPETNFPPFAT